MLLFFDAFLFFLMLLPIVPKEDQNPFSPRHLVEDTTVTVNVMVLDMPRKFVWRHDVTDVAHSQTFPNIGCMRSHMDMHFMLIMSIVVMRDPMVHFGPSIHVRFAALQMIDLLWLV